ncbi:unnamed protein product [Laminaria digitata]
MRAITALSREENTRTMISVARELVTEPFRLMHEEGVPIHDKVFVSILNWCIELFALVGLMSLTSRLLSVWLLAATMLAVLPSLGLLYVLDRRVFAYRKVVSDDTLASAVVICSFFASVCFIVLFLGLESVLEGISAGQGVSSWVQSMLGDETYQAEWGNTIDRVTEFAQETGVAFEGRYNETVWFPMARNAVTHYMEHGALMGTSETCGDESAGAVVGGFASTGGISGLIATVREHVSDLNISLEHVLHYGGPSGKVIANGVTLLATFGSFLVMVGFKVVLFFTCVFYMTSHDDFLERTVGDFLPIAEKDQKRAMNMLRGAIQGVFFLPCKVACLHGVVTLFSFVVLQIEFPFFAAFLAVLVSILPIVPAYIICWPWALTLVLHGRWVGVALAMSQYLIFSLIDTELYAQGVREANPYLTGLSSFLGFAVFGPQGVVLGPLIICLATLIYGGLGFLESSLPQDFAGGYLDPVVEVDDVDNLQTQQRPGHRSVHHHPSQTAPVEDALKAGGKHERSGLSKDDHDDSAKKPAAGSRDAQNASNATTVDADFSPALDAYGGDTSEPRVSTTLRPSSAPDESGGERGGGETHADTRRASSGSIASSHGPKGRAFAGSATQDMNGSGRSLQLAELLSSFVKNLQHTQRPKMSGDEDRPRLSRRVSDSGVDARLRGHSFSEDGNICAPAAAASVRVRVTLRLARHPVGTEEQPNESDNVQDQPSPGKVRSPSPRGTWRLVFSPSLEWEEFLHEVQDVMDIPGVRGIYEKGGARIRRVNFIEEGEILDVVPGDACHTGDKETDPFDR